MVKDKLTKLAMSEAELANEFKPQTEHEQGLLKILSNRGMLEKTPALLEISKPASEQ